MIRDELTVTTREDMLPGVQNNILTESPMVNVLLRFSRLKRGAAGNGIGINGLIDRNQGQFYRGFDTASRSHVDKHRRWYARWFNHQSYMVLSGTDLEENLGVPSDIFIDPNRSLSNLPQMQAETIISEAASELEGAVDKSSFDMVRTFWGKTTETDEEGRIPESIVDLFNENGEWHGLAVDDLGTFPVNDPWRDNPPGQTSTNIHEARYFDNSGTPRTIAKDILAPPILRMQARLSGIWVCGLYPDLYDSLSSEWDAQFDLQMGIGQIVFQVQAVRLHNVIYFPDDWAPTDRARHIHLGIPNGGGRNAGFFPYFWESTRSQRNLNARRRPNAMQVPQVGMTLGRNFQVPFYTSSYMRSETSADAITADLRCKYSWVGPMRWAHFEVRDLQA